MDSKVQLRVEILRQGKNFSVIGKKMRIRDNSYIKRIEPYSRGKYFNLIDRKVIIISEPYQKQVMEDVDLRVFGEHYVTMVRVYEPITDCTYETMFCEGWLEK